MLRPHAPFLSPPPRNERTVTVTLGGDTYSGWASAAVRTCEAGSSPACALDCLINEVQNITKSSERLTGHASMALATGGKLPWLMDVQDAKATLKFVAAKETRLSAKRKAAAEAAAAAELAQKERVGAARAAKRAKVAARPPKTKLQVDTLGRFRRS